MKAILHQLSRIAFPPQVREDLRLTPVHAEDALVMKDGIFVFTGELEEDPDLVMQRDREERFRKVAGLD